MKLLMIGMDSSYPAVFQRGWTPFISSLLEKQKQLDIKTDLMSRGWLEISLGRHGSITNALYDKPKADGTTDWTKSFAISDIPNRPDRIVPIWEALNQKGVSVGIMNVPTTFPAPRVDGFFVSGGGGGAPVTEKVEPALCYPQDIADELNKLDYIIDDRLYQLVVEKGLDTPAKIFERLAYKNDRRTQAFIEINKKHDVDFGFLVYKTSSVLAETFYLAEMRRRGNSQNASDETTVNAVRAYYQSFDKEIEKLVEVFPEADLMFVSDHGTVEHSFTVNPNVLLREAGLQKKAKGKSASKIMMSKLKEVIPFWLKAYLKKSPAMKLKNVGLIDFDPRSTLAFCYTVENWAHGIFINDKRFDGPVQSSEKPELTKKILELINSNPVASSHGIVARAAREDRVEQFPDIIIDKREGYLTSDKAVDFVAEFQPSKTDSALASIMKGEMLYLKSHYPMASIEEQQFEKIPQSMRSGDLTRICDVVVNYFEEIE